MRVKTISVSLLWVVMQIITNVAMGQYLDHQLETNVNKVDPLFERSVPNLEEFKTGIEADKKAISEQIGKNMMSPIADAGKIANERAKLESLDALEIDSIARAEFTKDPFHNEMFVDLSRPGMQAHLADAKKIAKGSSKMIEGIIANLKDIGMDCKTVKGNIEKDPEYFMELKKEVDNERQDTIYDQYFCERPQRQYICRDELTVTCKTQGTIWKNWEDRSINYHNIPFAWLTSIWDANGQCNEFCPVRRIKRDFQTMQLVRHAIANAIGASIEQIGEIIEIPFDGAGKLMWDVVGSWDGYDPRNLPDWGPENTFFDFINALSDARSIQPYNFWEYYVFKYQYRELMPTCVEWQEIRQEICRLN